jgi:hypothetical protein
MTGIHPAALRRLLVIVAAPFVLIAMGIGMTLAHGQPLRGVATGATLLRTVWAGRP